MRVLIPFVFCAAVCAASSTSVAQEAPRSRPDSVTTERPPAPARPRVEGAHRLSGPRFGLTVLNDATIRQINETFGTCTYDSQRNDCRYDDEIVSSAFPVITQFGWQFERQVTVSSNGLTILTETVILLGGLERGLALPSASLIVGVRTPGGLELGLGPNLSATGAAYAVAVGFANPLGDINVPINVAAVLGRDGPRMSLLVGLTFSDRRY